MTARYQKNNQRKTILLHGSKISEGRPRKCKYFLPLSEELSKKLKKLSSFKLPGEIPKKIKTIFLYDSKISDIRPKKTKYFLPLRQEDIRQTTKEKEIFSSSSTERYPKNYQRNIKIILLHDSKISEERPKKMSGI
ncbi:hypothetical protein AVEN_130129-1 [Araneus ventricosus]|uniref:Uncharacterized protein n=1 Tax=Araneus ventricosus TaxID=182803 RepID=A0A4Y2UPF3_ARAVE|nr:hypothetical protein AVEN_67155-1 [Araneus ventricosus]GBO14031.1 hypothetical protein AVEN_130129-1 [Araneus ventricosus]